MTKILPIFCFVNRIEQNIYSDKDLWAMLESNPLATRKRPGMSGIKGVAGIAGLLLPFTLPSTNNRNTQSRAEQKNSSQMSRYHC